MGICLLIGFSFIVWLGVRNDKRREEEEIEILVRRDLCR